MVCCQVRTESKNNSWRSFTCVMAMKLWHLNRWAWIMEYYGQNSQTDTLVIIIWGYWVSASAGGCPEDPEYDTMQQWDRAHCEICQGTAPDIRTVHAETMFMQLNRWCGPIRASVCVCVCSGYSWADVKYRVHPCFASIVQFYSCTALYT